MSENLDLGLQPRVQAGGRAQTLLQLGKPNPAETPVFYFRNICELVYSCIWGKIQHTLVIFNE